MMAMMTVQPPLPLAPHGARPVGAAAAIIEDEVDLDAARTEIEQLLNTRLKEEGTK
jgi:hypothetical protein